MPLAAALSSLFLFVEWVLCLTAPRVAAVAVHLHLAMFGGTLLSGFWSLVNERFDPYTAKRVVGRIGFGASAGGVAGGLLAWGASRFLPVPAMLLGMALLTLAAMAGMLVLGRNHVATSSPAATPVPAAPSALGTLRRVPYLQDLALVVAIGSITDSLLDYVLKSQAAATFSQGAQLLSFFAILNTSLALLTLVVQGGLSRPSLRTLGLAGTVAVRPAAVLVFGLVGTIDPRMWVAVLARAGHDISTSSLFRSGYELLFTPLPEHEKRPTKAVVDVGFDKLGSLLGGAIALLAVALVPSQTLRVLFGLSALLCIAALAFTGRLHRGYVRSLEQSLRAGRVRLSESDAVDNATLLTLAQTGLALDRNTLLREIEEIRARDEAASPDPLLQAISDLRSGDKGLVRLVLRQPPRPPSALVAHLLPLLAQDDLFLEALRALRRMAPEVTGQLVDALLDPQQDPAVRRRVPRVLKVCATKRAVDGLAQGLDDELFDVREQCAIALASISARNPELAVPRSSVFAVALREVQGGPEVLDLDHVFTLLSLALEREPLQIALQAVRGTDRSLRGTALEYLENVLPEALRAALWPSLGERAPARRTARPRQEVMEELLSSSAALPLSREALRARLPLGPPSRKS
jgi:hypothetical protein